jgi:hypothetical protein
MIPPIVASSMHWFGPVAVGIVTRNPVLRLPEFASGIVLYGLYREQRLSFITETIGRRLLALVCVAVSFATAAWLVADGALYCRDGTGHCVRAGCTTRGVCETLGETR